MSYQALYRKYRPATFNEVVGQQAIIQTLKNAVDQDRIGHAYLFCGPRGTGKTSIAKIFARMLNCTSENHDKPCGHCENCKMALNGSHPDIIEIDAASNNGVDEVRNLIDRVKYAPLEGKYKIYIIDEVHMMTTGAFNALLKTIEEPPAHVIFIFATTEPSKVLPTIISRCQRFDFSKVSQHDIEQRLNTVCQSEKIQIDPEGISLIASLSDGGMRDALSILDQCIAYSSDHIHTEDIRKIYGVVTTEDIAQTFDLLYKKDVNALIENIQNISDQGMDLKRFTSDFITLLKNSIIYEYAQDTTLIDNHMKTIIQKYMMSSSLTFRTHVLNVLMDTFNKYVYASNILDYLEAGLLYCISDSYDNKEKNQEISEKEKNIKSEKKYENTSSYSDELSEIKAKNSVKIADPMNISNQKQTDVSRETLKQSEIINSKIILNDEYVISLLVGANKKERQQDEEKYEKRNQFLNDIRHKRTASLLRKSKVIASGTNYLVVGVKTDVESKAINEYENTEGFDKFTKELLEKPKRIFSIDYKQQKRVFKEFKERMKNHTLPDPAVVKLNEKENVEEDDESKEEKELKKLFPDLIVKED